MSATLYIIGTGPGDPELLTLKAVNHINKSQVIIAPRGSKSGKSTALGIVAEVVELASRLDYLLNPGIAKLDYIARIHIDEVIVLHAAVGLFKLGDIFAELMFHNHAAVEQQLNGIVKCSSAYPVIFVLHEDIE